jgi:hypothetical protein
MSKWDDRQERDALYLKALEKWGKAGQMCKTIEECCELGASMSRVLNAPVGHDAVQELECMLGELVDVRIMTEQMALAFGEFDKVMKEMRDAKLDRLEGFLKEDEARE